jgi:hypothetical protein
MSSRDVLQVKRADIVRVAALHGGRNVRVFGSAARGHEGPSSDVDFLVEFEDVHSSSTWRVYGRIWKIYWAARLT